MTWSDQQILEEALSELAARPDLEVQDHLPDLFLIFDDACEQIEVMWGLLHLIEEFQWMAVICAFGQVIPKLVESAPQWTRTFMNRVLNGGPKTYLPLKDLLPSLPNDTQVVISSILRAIAAEYPEKKDKVEEIIGENL